MNGWIAETEQDCLRSYILRILYSKQQMELIDWGLWFSLINCIVETLTQFLPLLAIRSRIPFIPQRNYSNISRKVTIGV